MVVVIQPGIRKREGFPKRCANRGVQQGRARLSATSRDWIRRDLQRASLAGWLAWAFSSQLTTLWGVLWCLLGFVGLGLQGCVVTAPPGLGTEGTEPPRRCVALGGCRGKGHGRVRGTRQPPRPANPKQIPSPMKS